MSNTLTQEKEKCICWYDIKHNRPKHASLVTREIEDRVVKICFNGEFDKRNNCTYFKKFDEKNYCNY